MFRNALFLLLFTTAFSQAQDLTYQLETLRRVAPEATSIGIIYQADTLPSEEIIRAANHNQIQVVSAPIHNLRDFNGAIRTLQQNEVDLILMMEHPTVTAQNAVKMVVKRTIKKQTPVFTDAETGIAAGAYGRLMKKDGSWMIVINEKVVSLYNLTVPEGEGIVLAE